ncbi:hypothetical protein PLESTB_001223800 [Pleodorina starrii]|uniref:Uncharacterized protein n=1 Tax=Pleodorina starrii TaxID=330485 RepID=A0A9W6F5P6_9CHLO|nr:hypothetical protein PLESTM_001897600 [Pleodorina starrii]GLC57432.1 hypothetical protein PLESTB_001223800 [Pleodorina starrii]GLC77068.1 hypothetical protein PLESTF_001879900 [Pleodorina starrii]
MEAADDADFQPRPSVATKPVHVPSLRECCVKTLQKYRQYLGDVGFMDVESLRAIAWHCSPEQLACIEDETLVGSDRNLEWYTWHLWKRHLKADLGDGGQQVQDLESEKPVDYEPPRGIDDEPGDYRGLYFYRKAEMEERSAAARERIAAANQQVMEAKESRKAKMIDKLAPAKRARCSTGGSRGAHQSASLSSAYLHKPRADSRSSLMSKPGAQLKLLSELGLVKKAQPRSTTTTTTRIVKPAPVPSAAMGRSSSLAGAALLNKATGGQLGRTGVGIGSGSGRGLHVPAQQPQVAARAAAVAAAAASRISAPAPAGSVSSGAGSSVSSPPPGRGKRPADGPPGAAPPTKLGQGSGAGGAASSRPDPRVMFPRQAPPTSAPGQSKFAVPTVRPVTASVSTAGSGTPPPHQRSAGSAGAGRLGASAAAPRPFDDL